MRHMQQAIKQFLLLLVFLSGSVLAAGSRPLDGEEGGNVVVPLHSQVSVSQDMSELGHLSRENRVPILLMFSTEECTYCKRLEADVLGPMRLAGVDPKRIILRKVLMDQYDTLRDFNGKQRNAESFGIARGVEVVPTLQLVDASGKELVPKIVGYQTPGLYGAYLEQAINVSQGLLNGQ